MTKKRVLQKKKKSNAMKCQDCGERFPDHIEDYGYSCRCGLMSMSVYLDYPGPGWCQDDTNVSMDARRERREAFIIRKDQHERRMEIKRAKDTLRRLEGA